MNSLTLGIFLSLLVIINCYNPIPMGAVIITTVSQIFVMRPVEYGGKDALDTIFTAMNITIVSSIFDPTARNLYIMYMNTTNGSLFLSQLVSTDTLSSTVYQLPITFNTANIDQMISFSSDVDNRRAFYTNPSGVVSLFSMSGLLSTTISLAPLDTTSIIQSVSYTSFYNRLFVITNTTVDSCTNLDTNNLQCCGALPGGTQFRALTFDIVNGDLYAYVLDRTTGIYRIILNGTGCPTALRPLNNFGAYTNLQFAIDRGLYFASGSALSGQDNSYLYIANGTNDPRSVPIGHKIVAIHISPPNTQSTSPTDETCFHGVTYTLYRTAVVLAALFGTIMGIFMCFNALFCIDFFMTKSIIRGLKEQIPHNLLEDRWNKLVEEKYAKLALEKQRKKDDPPPPPRRKSSVSGRKNSSAVIPINSDDNPDTRRTTNEAPQYLSARPSIADYIRRKSESYLNRRRSDDPRSSRHQQPEELAEIRSYPARTQMTTAQVHIEPLHEERERKGLRQNLSRKELLKDEDFL